MSKKLVVTNLYYARGKCYGVQFLYIVSFHIGSCQMSSVLKLCCHCQIATATNCEWSFLFLPSNSFNICEILHEAYCSLDSCGCNPFPPPNVRIKILLIKEWWFEGKLAKVIYHV